MSYNHANNAESCSRARSSWNSLSAQLSPSSGPADEQGGVSCAVPAHCARIAKTTTAIYVLVCPFVNEIVSIVIGTHIKMAMRNFSSTIFSLWRAVEISRGAGAPCRNSLLGKREEKTEVKGRNPAKGGGGGCPAYCRMSCKSLLSNASSALLYYFMNTCNSRYY